MKPNPLLNPVDWFNFFGVFKDIFQGQKNCNMLSDNEACMMDPKDLDPMYINKPTFILDDKTNLVRVCKNNPFDLAVNVSISKFMLLTAVKFKGDFFTSMSYVSFSLMKSDVPYIRVGTDYYKVIDKDDRYGSVHKQLKPWKKDEIKEDHTKSMLSLVFKYDDFCILPNNKTHIPVKNNCYNLYAKFIHKETGIHVLESEIPTTMVLMNHIFGDQVELGFKYMKILYEHPRQILPIFCLISEERETGKTTYLNWIQMLFGENSTIISPIDLSRNFNSGYAGKNIIMIDETVIDKSSSIEKLKSLATAKTISVDQKYVQQYSIPFFAKIILCTNKEKDFMRIDDEEIRFWVRKIKVITGTKNTNIEQDLFNEIPRFLRYLSQLPAIDFSRSRMVFTKEEIGTIELAAIKEESKSGLRKELEILIEDRFNNYGLNEFKASAKDIKEEWFNHNNQISMAYIRTVLKNEMKYIPSKEIERYVPFGKASPDTKTGTPFTFKSNLPVNLQNNNDSQTDLPF